VDQGKRKRLVEKAVNTKDSESRVGMTIVALGVYTGRCKKPPQCRDRAVLLLGMRMLAAGRFVS
jgi:hypothetical protein